jgi:hypothetical protein
MLVCACACVRVDVIMLLFRVEQCPRTGISQPCQQCACAREHARAARVHVTISLRLRGPRTAMTALHEKCPRTARCCIACKASREFQLCQQGACARAHARVARVHVTISLRMRVQQTVMTALHCLLPSFHATILCSTALIVRPKR